VLHEAGARALPLLGFESIRGPFVQTEGPPFKEGHILATIFVGNLPPEIKDTDLRTMFEQYGKVTALRYMARRGIAYVETDEDAANAAVDALRGTQLSGRTLDIAVEQSFGGGKPGGRRGRR
jgi:RNA recognition motif-containing protein